MDRTIVFLEDLRTEKNEEWSVELWRGVKINGYSKSKFVAISFYNELWADTNDKSMMPINEQFAI